MTTLGPEDLDALYNKWHDMGSEQPSHYKKTYSRVARNFGPGKRFEDWLWSNGFKVVQRDKKRWLEFAGDNKQLTFFLLKYMS
jgi:hypothetical protein